MQHNLRAKLVSGLTTKYSQFPLWDFFECNKISIEILDSTDKQSSQFPLWDFFECNWNEILCGHPWVPKGTSQFPLWDFFECNLEKLEKLEKRLDRISQFPLWDFFECNRA